METMTTVLSGDPDRRPLATHRPAPMASGATAGRLMTGAVAAAGDYAQRAGATWLMWLRVNSDKPPHEDF